MSMFSLTRKLSKNLIVNSTWLHFRGCCPWVLILYLTLCIVRKSVKMPSSNSTGGGMLAVSFTVSFVPSTDGKMQYVVSVFDQEYFESSIHFIYGHLCTYIHIYCTLYKYVNIMFYIFYLYMFSLCVSGLFDRRKCPKGKHCNFLHVFRNPGNEFWEADRDLHLSPDRNGWGSRRDGSQSERHGDYSWRQRHGSRSPTRSDRSHSRREDSWSRERRMSHQDKEDKWWSRHSDRRNARYLHRRDRTRSRSRDREEDRRRTRSREKDRERKSRNRSEDRDKDGDTRVESQERSRSRSTERERDKRSREKSPKKSDKGNLRSRHKHSKKSKKKSKKKRKKKSHRSDESASSGDSEEEKNTEEVDDNNPAASHSEQVDENTDVDVNSDSKNQIPMWWSTTGENWTIMNKSVLP